MQITRYHRLLCLGTSPKPSDSSNLAYPEFGAQKIGGITVSRRELDLRSWGVELGAGGGFLRQENWDRKIGAAM